jgi:tRNA pseudouridine55 synthase
MIETGPRVYLFDKEEGISTFDLIRRHRKNITAKKEKIGHFGTLDPFATGLVLIGVGGATRLNEYVHQFLPKTYYARGKVGIQTDSGDKSGEEIDREAVSLEYSVSELDKLVKEKFLGEYLQRPHAVSATKKDGKELYKWAKEGIIIEKPPVKREIYHIEVLNIDNDVIELSCTCSSGTYIRVLFEDIMREICGKPLGHLLDLRRTSYGHINLDHSSIFKNDKYLSISLLDLLPMDLYTLSDDRIKSFKNGLSTDLSQSLQVEQGSVAIPHKAWVIDSERKLAGMADLEGRVIKPKVVFQS